MKIYKYYLNEGQEYLWYNPVTKNTIRKLSKYLITLNELEKFIKNNNKKMYNDIKYFLEDMLIMIPYIDIRGLNKNKSLNKIKEFINFQKNEMNFNLLYNIIGGENIKEIRIGANGKIIVDMKDGKFFWL